MSAWRPLVEVLSGVDEGASGAPTAVLQQASEAYATNVSAEPLYGKQQARGMVAPLQSSQNANDAAQSDGATDEDARKSAYNEGMALARKETEALALRYHQSIEELVRTKEHVVRSCEQDLVKLALTIAREVLMADVTGREHFTQRMVEHALQLMGDAQNMTLRLAPQNLASLRQHKPEMMRRLGIQWLEDESLALGGVVVEADSGKLDATIAGRLEAMAAKLLQDNQ